jgi:hypothetical protein
MEVSNFRIRMVATDHLEFSIVPKQLVHTATKSKKYQGVYAEKLDNIKHHATQRNLQRTQMRVDAEDVHKLQDTVGYDKIVYYYYFEYNRFLSVT